MNRDEAIALMTDTINRMNREMAVQHNISLEDFEQQIVGQQEQLTYVNGLLYDILYEHGVINTNR